MSRLRSPWALALSIIACGGGEPAPSSPDASINHDADGGVPADGSTSPAVEAGADAIAPTPDANSSDAADAADAGNGSTITGCTPGSTLATLTSGDVKLEYDLTAGTARFSYAGVSKIAPFYAGVQLTTYITSKAYSAHECSIAGDQMIITNSANGLPTMKHTFLAPRGNHLLTQVSVSGSGLASNWIAPVVMDTAGGVDVGSHADSRVLWVPFDNDSFARYSAASIDTSGVSFEVAAFYDNTSRHGIVVGSVTHDTWKTGVYYVGKNDTLSALNVFGGANDPNWTHDVIPHGQVKGDSIASPVMFVGYGPDWRDLLEEYADANAAYAPKLDWTGGVPFGWNSWGKLQTTINYDKAIAVSDFVKSNLQNANFENNGVTYINLDSYWDNLNDTQIAGFAAHCHANGQKAGIYWAPFVDWGKSATRQVEGATQTTYDKIWVKDGAGNPVEIDGAYAVDPTHAAAKARIDYFIDKFKAWGFDYVKLDFLTHGALESTARFDPTVQTGIAAYGQGMKYIRDRIAGTMFISESIAPLFPYQYAHARRVSCDTTGQAEYEMNSASYGFWMSGRLYPYNDPDMVVFEGFTDGENMSRLLSAVVGGTVFLDGDDLTGANGQTLAKKYLTNGAINAVARLGKPFRPVEGASGTASTDQFVLRDGSDTYVAAFNFGAASASKLVDIARLGLDNARTFTATDLWSGSTTSVSGTVNVRLDASSAKLIKLR